VETRSSTRVSGDVCVVRLGPRTSRRRTCHAWWRLVVRGGDLSCEAETCRARRRLVVRGGDFSCEPKTGSFCGKLVGDATNWLRIGRLASEGLDEDPHTTTQAELQANGGLLLDVVVGKGTTILKLLASESEESTSRSCCLRGDNLAVKGGPNPGPCQ
jgi:hypothetical protein